MSPFPILKMAFIFSLTKAGVRLAFMDEYSVYKRIHSQSYTHMYDEHAFINR